MRLPHAESAKLERVTEPRPRAAFAPAGAQESPFVTGPECAQMSALAAQRSSLAFAPADPISINSDSSARPRPGPPLVGGWLPAPPPPSSVPLCWRLQSMVESLENTTPSAGRDCAGGSVARP